MNYLIENYSSNNLNINYKLYKNNNNNNKYLVISNHKNKMDKNNQKL